MYSEFYGSSSIAWYNHGGFRDFITSVTPGVVKGLVKTRPGMTLN